MASAFDVYRSVWWRFSKYELRDGYVRPVQGAQLLEYDPWKAYRESWDYDPESATPWPEKRQSVPYQSLLALLDGFRFGPLGDPMPESAENLLAWCSEHGLLGVLPQRTHFIATARRWFPEAGDAMREMIEGRKLDFFQDNHNLYESSIHYFRHNAYDRLRGWYPIRYTRPEPESGHQVGEVCDDTSETLRPHVLIQDMRPVRLPDLTAIVTPAYYEEPLIETWGTFFPDVPQDEKETYLYPLPLSDRFWNLYAETVTDFLTGAAVLAQAIRCLNSDDEETVSHGVLSLNSLVSSASMMLRPAGGSFVQEWRASSLLGDFAVMALQDLTQQRRLLNCETCNKPFITDSYQARYCGETCRRTAQKRRYRQKLKDTQSKEKEVKRNDQARPSKRGSTSKPKKSRN